MMEIKVTDEAVAAAAEGLRSHPAYEEPRVLARSALEAAVSHLQVQAGDACIVCGGSGFATQGVPCADSWHDDEIAAEDAAYAARSLQVDREALILLLHDENCDCEILKPVGDYKLERFVERRRKHAELYGKQADAVLALLSPESCEHSEYYTDDDARARCADCDQPMAALLSPEETKCGCEWGEDGPAPCDLHRGIVIPQPAAIATVRSALHDRVDALSTSGEVKP